jgi:hypothetical protein
MPALPWSNNCTHSTRYRTLQVQELLNNVEHGNYLYEG